MAIIQGVTGDYQQPASAGQGLAIRALQRQLRRQDLSKRALRAAVMQLTELCQQEIRLGNEQMFPGPIGQNGGGWDLFAPLGSGGANSSYVFNPALYGTISYWNMQQAAGANAPDAVGSNTLTQNNSPTQGTGQGNFANAAVLVAASSQDYSVASNSGLQTGNVDFWVAVWIKTTFGTQKIISKSLAAGLAGEFAIGTVTAGGAKVQFAVYSGAAQTQLNHSFAYNDNAWHLVVCYQDIANNLIGSSIDGGAATTTPLTVTATTNTQPFIVGAAANPSTYFQGSIGPCGFGKPSSAIGGLISGLIATLWNGGNGGVVPF